MVELGSDAPSSLAVNGSVSALGDFVVGVIAIKHGVGVFGVTASAELTLI